MPTKDISQKHRVVNSKNLAFSLRESAHLLFYILGDGKKDMKGKNKNTRPDSQRSLSTREREVLMWLRCGKTSWAISVILKISERTVNFHANNIMSKLGVINRMQAVSVAFDNELGNAE